MDPRLRRKHHTILLQKRDVKNHNELYEMMRSRQVYYVQNELRKELDRTLMGIKQAEKLQLAGLRLQRILFLKRTNNLESKRRQLTNVPDFVNNNLIYHHCFGNSKFPTKVESKRENGFVSSFYHKLIPRASIGQIESYFANPTNGNGQKVQKGNHLNIDVGRDTSKEVLEKANLEASINSEWMYSIRNEQRRKSLAPAYVKKENIQAMPENSQENKFSRKYSKPNLVEYEQTETRPITESNKQLLKEPTGVSKTFKKHGTLKTQKKKAQDENLKVLSTSGSHFNKSIDKRGSNIHLVLNKTPSNNSFEKNKNEKGGELSVMNDLQGLSLTDDNQKFSGHSPREKANQKIVKTRVKTEENNVDNTIKNTQESGLNTSGSLSLNDLDKFFLIKEKGAINPIGIPNKITKHTKSDMTDKNELENYQNEQDNIRNVDNCKTPAQSSDNGPCLTQQVNISPTQIPRDGQSLQKPFPDHNMPYPGTAQEVTSNKTDIFIKQGGHSQSLSPTVSRERTVTMIFVEDTDDSQDPPKSQFDFAARLAYNRRKRGSSKIFNEKSFLVITDDENSDTSDKRGQKKGPKHNVRFSFTKRSKKQTLHKTESLSFRKRSIQWYQNFLKDGQRHSNDNQNGGENIKSVSKLINKSIHKLLPDIGYNNSGSSFIDSGTDNAAKFRMQKLTIDKDSQFVRKKINNEKLQRLRDHSNFLQMKIQKFIYS